MKADPDRDVAPDNDDDDNDNDAAASGASDFISDEPSTSPSASMDEEESWIASFCSVTGHEYFAEVSEDFIEDDFNLTGLGAVVPLYDPLECFFICLFSFCFSPSLYILCFLFYLFIYLFIYMSCYLWCFFCLSPIAEQT